MSGQPNSPIEVKASEEIGYYTILGFLLINTCGIKQSLGDSGNKIFTFLRYLDIPFEGTD
jgi:hypothetical protein